MVIKNKKWKSYSIFSVVLLVAIFLFEILPDYTDLFSNMLEAIRSNNVTEEIDTCEAQINRLNKTNIELTSSLSFGASTYTKKEDISSIINFLNLIAKESYIDDYSLKPSEILKKDNYWVLPISIEITGDFSVIYNFLNFIESSRRIVVIRNISITPTVIAKDELLLKTNMEFYLNL